MLAIFADYVLPAGTVPLLPTPDASKYHLHLPMAPGPGLGPAALAAAGPFL